MRYRRFQSVNALDVVLVQKDEGSATRVFCHHSFIHSIQLFELMYDRYMEEWNEASKGGGVGVSNTVHTSLSVTILLFIHHLLLPKKKGTKKNTKKKGEG